jgi:hypothetical protein
MCTVLTACEVVEADTLLDEAADHVVLGCLTGQLGTSLLDQIGQVINAQVCQVAAAQLAAAGVVTAGAPPGGRLGGA